MADGHDYPIDDSGYEDLAAVFRRIPIVEKPEPLPHVVSSPASGALLRPEGSCRAFGVRLATQQGKPSARFCNARGLEPQFLECYGSVC
jgi:hypothetical protein